MIVNMVAPWERNTVTCLEYTRMQQLYSYLRDKPGTVTFATRPKTGEMTPLICVGAMWFTVSGWREGGIGSMSVMAMLRQLAIGTTEINALLV